MSTQIHYTMSAHHGRKAANLQGLDGDGTGSNLGALPAVFNFPSRNGALPSESYRGWPRDKCRQRAYARYRSGG